MIANSDAFNVALTERVWPPPKAILPDAVFPVTVPVTGPLVKHGEPVNETVPVRLDPLWVKFAVSEPPVQLPLQFPVKPDVDATANNTGADGPPPGGGLVTTTGKVPKVARSDALSVMIRLPPLVREAGCTMPLNVTDEDETKPLPLIVNIRGPDPAGAEGGDRPRMVG